MEQENLFPEVLTEKLYKPINIYAATFFGGPLVGGYLIAANYKVLNEHRNVAKTWVFTIIGSILLEVLYFFVETRSSRNIPGYVIPIIYSVIVFNTVKIFQKPKIEKYISAGGKFHPESRVFAVTIIGLIITILLALLSANIFDILA